MCVRLDSYESEEHKEWVRRFLDGSFENSVFCILAPDGQEWLTNSGRGPEHVLGRSTSRTVAAMARIADRYETRGDPAEALVEDFHSVRQALNVASADQRPLVLAAGSESEIQEARSALRPVFNHADVVGRFHFDFDAGSEWRAAVDGAAFAGGLHIVRPGEFGLKGATMAVLPLDSDADRIRRALEEASEEYARTTAKKVYSRHVEKGRRQGVRFESAVEYGEDRDGDGRIDRGPSGRSRARSSDGRFGPPQGR